MISTLLAGKLEGWSVVPALYRQREERGRSGRKQQPFLL